MTTSTGFEHLGRTLDALRGLWNVSETTMARECQVGRSTLQNRFKGVGPAPRADELQRYAEFFRLPIEVLLLPTEEAVVTAVRDHGFLSHQDIREFASLAA